MFKSSHKDKNQKGVVSYYNYGSSKRRFGKAEVFHLKAPVNRAQDGKTAGNLNKKFWQQENWRNETQNISKKSTQSLADS